MGDLWGLSCAVVHSPAICNGRRAIQFNQNNRLGSSRPIRNAWVGGSNPSTGTIGIKVLSEDMVNTSYRRHGLHMLRGQVIGDLHV